MARTPRAGATTRTRTTGATTSRRTPRTSATSRTGAALPGPHRSLWGSITHAVHHPGLSDIAAVLAPPMGAAWLAEHSHVPGLTQAGRATQALFESPLYLAAHPRSGARNLGQIASGLMESPYALYKASGLNPILQTAVHPFAPKYTRTGLYSRATPGGAGGRTVGEGALNALHLLWESTKADYSARYGKNWKTMARKEPLFNVGDLLMVTGPASKAASAAKALRALEKLGVGEEEVLAARRAILDNAGDTNWNKLGPVDKLKLVKAEVRQPGLVTTGKARTRTITVRSGEGEPIVTEGPVSTTPFRRGFQSANDALAQTFPNLPLAGARSRVLRGTARQISRATDRVLASIPGAESLKKLPAAGRERAYWQAQVVKHLTDDAGNVVHDHEAATTKLKQLHEALTHEYGHPGWEAKVKAEFPEFRDVVDMAKQRAFGTETLKGLEDAIRYKPGKHYENVINALKHATVVGENSIRDTEGFSTLNNVRTKLVQRLRLLPEGSEEIPKVHDHIAQIDDLLNAKHSFIEQMLTGSRRKVVDYMNTAPVHDAPERAAWGKAMADLGWTPQQVEDGQIAGDVRARVARPDDPASYWAERIGSPAGMTPQQVAVRAHALWQDFPEQGQTMLIEESALGVPAPTSAYHSQVQKAIADAWGPKPLRQAGTVKKELETKYKQEYDNMELDNFFGGRDKNEMISQEQLQTFLATSLNRYNIRETHFVNTEYARDQGLHPLYGSTEIGSGSDWGDLLLSRTPEEGEYHEIPFDFPDGIPRPTPYTGKGQDHWYLPNVPGHVRFQVFKEDGKLKLLIEEVQSDWARQHTVQKKRGIEYGMDEPGWNDKYNQLSEARIQAARADDKAYLDMRQLENKRDELEWRVEQGKKEGWDAASIADDENSLKDLQAEVLAAQKLTEKTDDAVEKARLALAKHLDTKKGSIPPPMMNAAKAQRLGVHRILRHAAEHGIDEVIVVDGHTQNARNLVEGASRGVDDIEGVWERVLTRQSGEPAPLGGGRSTFHRSGRTPAEARALAEADIGDTHFTRVYEQEIPDLIEARTGVKGRVVEDAYQGHMGTQHGQRTETGPMRGTVYKMNDAARSKAVEPDFLYQRQPEWNNVPRGANELLVGKGDRLIHMFQNADISTWIHELGHSALYDLSEEDRGILNAHYGAGAKDIFSWANASHENYARDWERFVRTGDLSFLPAAISEVFQRIQGWMQRVYREAKNANPEAEIPAQVEDVFRRMLLPEGDTPDIFMPHRARAASTKGTRMQTGTPRATRAVNAEVVAREPFFKRNRLALLRSGMLDRDPAHLFEHVNRLMALQKANQIREFLLLHSEPLTQTWNVDFNDQYVVKAAGTNPNKVLYDALEAADNPEDIRATISKFVDDNIIDSKDKLAEAWKGDQQLYVIDKKLADELFLNVTGKVPGQATKQPGLLGQGADAAMNTLRGLLLYGNPGFYVANMAGNFGMQMFNDPRSVKFLKDAVTKRGDLYHRVTTEMGRGPTAGGLNPERAMLGRDISGHPLSGRNLYQSTTNAFEWWNHKLNVAGRKAGSVVDDPFRYATWRQEASKLGYKTDAQVRELLDQGIKDTREHGFKATDTKALGDLNKIRDRAEQLMLDFDSLTPFERSYLTRVIFLYPFLKASAKYPFFYAGEHPFTMGALLQGSNVSRQVAEQSLGPRPALPEWAQGYARTPWGMVNIGSVDQLSVLGSELQSILGAGTATPVGVNRPFNMLHPGLQLLIELAQSRNRYGREANAGSILKTDAPLPAWITQLWREPSQLYTGRSYWDTLLRSLRLAPFGVNEDYGGGGG